MILKNLAEETRPIHEKVERENVASKIMDHTISLYQYGKLLVDNYIAYSTLEAYVLAHKAKLPHVLLPFVGEDKSTALMHDLNNLHESLPETYPFNPVDNSWPALAGMIYVMEGSMLGGMLMAKNIKQCPSLANLGEQYFFTGDTASKATRWKQFKEVMGSIGFDEAQTRSAITGAKEAFAYFETVYARGSSR